MKKSIRLLTFITSLILLSACAPEVGSEKWCDQMKEKSKGDWTANEMADFTKHCIF
jgi:protein involved in sex pheromone biosynthesis